MVKVNGYLLVIDVYVQYGEVKCCVFVHHGLRAMIFSNVYDGFSLVPVGGGGCCKLSDEWQ